MTPTAAFLLCFLLCACTVEVIALIGSTILIASLCIYAHKSYACWLLRIDVD
uniref:Uncharacterized protein n=1 Tax=Anguilla anguilla TaxID=7936 RepID=A0A0E9WA03_ANGAN